MIKQALFVRLEAKSGKEKELAQFLQAGLGMADEAGRQAHLNGPIAQALGANAPKLLAQPPSIERIDVLGAKLPG
jgi:hypothetical protein